MAAAVLVSCNGAGEPGATPEPTVDVSWVEPLCVDLSAITDEVGQLIESVRGNLRRLAEPGGVLAAIGDNRHRNYVRDLRAMTTSAQSASEAIRERPLPDEAFELRLGLIDAFDRLAASSDQALRQTRDIGDVYVQPSRLTRASDVIEDAAALFSGDVRSALRATSVDAQRELFACGLL